jgi:hypothetical protein
LDIYITSKVPENLKKVTQKIREIFVNKMPQFSNDIKIVSILKKGL